MQIAGTENDITIWEGRVLDVGDDVFVAELHDIDDENEILEADCHCSLIREEDRDLFYVGSPTTQSWAMGRRSR